MVARIATGLRLLRVALARKQRGPLAYSWQRYALDFYSRQGYGLESFVNEFSASWKQRISGKLGGNIVVYFRQGFA